MEKKDIISTMPNEIISNILSRLTIKEAGRTSILSTRWRYQWTYFFGVVNFDHSLKNYNLRRQNKLNPLRKSIVFVSEWKKFMSDLEHVLKSLKCPTMQGLRICMELGNPQKVAQWVKFAAEKNVQVLELNFFYNFTTTFFEISEKIRNVISSTSFEMKSLCVLRLSAVDVTGEVIEHFLATCPSLETLCVIESKSFILRLKVSGQALKLKHLELVEVKIIHLDISAENLMTFRYSGGFGRFNFESVPNLVEASFGGRYSSYLQPNMNNVDLFGLISQLNVLKLDLFPHDKGILEGLPEFTNVKHLELQIPHTCGGKMDRALSLLSAFPSICVLKVKFLRCNMKPEEEEEWEANLKGEFPNLKELGVSGYRRDTSQIELLISIVENAPNLNKIVVDPLSSYYVDISPDDVRAWIRKRRHGSAKWYADGLKQYVPPQIEVIVL
ncbi:F-box/LRR-repeat protein At3g58900-like [Gastrolobium bilobum]|uniref:F-box/LRR-repeat protein At3g58900-like n=1 Tax=Gastrolobium bilobum TaxID=150636 RepID=UPI002AB26C91|nr:F-box/LRR-repeat protein At3g58900-like [Gastrolobium bilobum]